MAQQTFHIPKISCGHCTMTIEHELKELAGVTSVVSNVAEKKVSVTWQPPATVETIRETLKEINFPAA